jgi:uncharacterized membrane protein YdbT with pleckstrin-like domain
MMELRPEERVLCAVRQHWLIFLLETAFLAALAFLPLIELFLPDLAGTFGFSIMLGAPALFLTATWLLFLWVTFFVIWTNYYLDAWIVTDQRLIDIEQHGLFNRSVSECRLDRIQDVTAEVKGFLPTLLKYGNVTIQTAGEQGRFVMRNVPEPYALKDIIAEAHKVIPRRADGHS